MKSALRHADGNDRHRRTIGIKFWVCGSFALRKCCQSFSAAKFHRFGNVVQLKLECLKLCRERTHASGCDFSSDVVTHVPSKRGRNQTCVSTLPLAVEAVGAERVSISWLILVYSAPPFRVAFQLFLRVSLYSFCHPLGRHCGMKQTHIHLLRPAEVGAP